ncbi:MAG: hypothetical protein ACTHNG_16150 [Ginsengibacter sp.]
MKISSIAFAAAILFFSCKKEKAPTPKVYSFSFYSEPLQYVQIPLNKYFIYKDSASGALDSVVVTESKLETKYEPSVTSNYFFTTPAYYYQSFSLLLTKSGSAGGDWFYGETIDRPYFGYSTALSDSISLTLVEKDRATQEDVAFAFVFNASTNTADSIIPSLTIEGKTYTNVLRHPDWNGLDSLNEFYRESVYYWVKGLGIIKRRIKTPGSIKTQLLIRNG